MVNRTHDSLSRLEIITKIQNTLAILKIKQREDKLNINYLG